MRVTRSETLQNADRLACLKYVRTDHAMSPLKSTRQKSLRLFYYFQMLNTSCSKTNSSLKVHKNENFFACDFELCTISLLVLLKY